MNRSNHINERDFDDELFKMDDLEIEGHPTQDDAAEGHPTEDNAAEGHSTKYLELEDQPKPPLQKRQSLTKHPVYYDKQRFKERAAADDRKTDETGMMGEQMAVAWLRSNGYIIHETNWRYKRYELDIVAYNRGVLHFIEVKTRKFGGLSSPEEALDRNKINAFVTAVKAYCRLKKVIFDVQYDLIAIDTYRFRDWDLRHYERVIF